MALKTSQWFRILLTAVLISGFVMAPLANTGVEAAPAAQEDPNSDQAGTTAAAQDDRPADLPAESPVALNATAEAVRLGQWPAQTATSQGAIQPDRYGPQRNDPAEGIPVHAYSPFDERHNREYPCPPGGCNFETGHVLVKLAAGVEVASPARQQGGEFTGEAALDAALSSQGIVRLEPIFPTAEPPQPKERIVDPDGLALPKPDLTRWYVAVFASDTADVYGAVEALAKAPGVVLTEPDYLRKPVGELLTTGTQRHSEELGELAEPAQAPDFDDPLVGQQWHLGGTNVPQAWQWLSDHSLPPGGSRDIVVAVIDTGVDYTHPDLAANMWVNAAEFNGTPGVDDDGNGFVDDIYGADTVTPDGNPQDDHGHGTHVAGVIAAQAGNGLGGVGVAYNVQIMALKAAQYSGVLAGCIRHRRGHLLHRREGRRRAQHVLRRLRPLPGGGGRAGRRLWTGRVGSCRRQR